LSHLKRLVTRIGAGTIALAATMLSFHPAAGLAEEKGKLESRVVQRSPLLQFDRDVSQACADSGFAKALAPVLSDDAALLWPGASLQIGSASILDYLHGQAKLDSVSLTWQPLGQEMAGDESVGITWGVMVVVRRGNPVPPSMGRYIAAWRHEGNSWRLQAMSLVGLPILLSKMEVQGGHLQHVTPQGPAAAFMAADREFAKLAAQKSAELAFGRYASPSVTLFASTGVLIRGPENAAALVAGPAKWAWSPVMAGSSNDGSLGWTIGESVIQFPAGPFYGKYLTGWVRTSDGPRFFIDGGNVRPASGETAQE